jgi:very-short-patch-repair endonuclease
VQRDEPATGAHRIPAGGRWFCTLQRPPVENSEGHAAPRQHGDMAATEVLTQLGGRATWTQLRRHLTWSALDAAVGRGEVVKLARGRYALPELAQHARVAHRHTAVLSHHSAAVAHGWSAKWPPTTPWITVPRNRKMSTTSRRGLHVAYRDVSSRERSRGVTGHLRTVLDCAMKLPFDEALCIADSALRVGDVDRDELQAAAGRLRGPGAGEARRVAALADGRAANPFESCLRAIALEVEGLTLRPQVQVAEPGLFATVDLGDVVRKVAIEAEGFEFHGTRSGLERDCRRYTELTIYGWRVLRFTWHDVMYRSDWVRWTIETLVAELDGRPTSPPPTEVRRAMPG